MQISTSLLLSMFKYRRLMEEGNTENYKNNNEIVIDKLLEVEPPAIAQQFSPSSHDHCTMPSSSHHHISSSHPHPEEFHSVFSEDEFQHELESEGPRVTGPGGVFLPRAIELQQMLDHRPDSISVMCFTWNIAGKANRSLPLLSSVFAKMPAHERPALIAVALQVGFFPVSIQCDWLYRSCLHPPSNSTPPFSNPLDNPLSPRIVSSAGSENGLKYPEYRFVAGNKMARPFRTKGAIGIRFRLLQCQCVFLACHLTHGSLEQRILDYHKIADKFDFDSLSKRNNGIHTHLFWFGDLNFRVLKTDELTTVVENIQKRWFRRQADFQQILAHDELSQERQRGLFKGFREAIVRFAPTHKFRIGTSVYASNRMPSYTDRVLFLSDSNQSLRPVRYDCIWEATCSDHKPVYCTFLMKVLRNGSGEVPQ